MINWINTPLAARHRRHWLWGFACPNYGLKRNLRNVRAWQLRVISRFFSSNVDMPSEQRWCVVNFIAQKFEKVICQNSTLTTGSQFHLVHWVDIHRIQDNSRSSWNRDCNVLPTEQHADVRRDLRAATFYQSYRNNDLETTSTFITAVILPTDCSREISLLPGQMIHGRRWAKNRRRRNSFTNISMARAALTHALIDCQVLTGGGVAIYERRGGSYGPQKPPHW